MQSFSPSSVCIPGAGTDTATPVAEMICAAAVPAVKDSYRTETVSMHYSENREIINTGFFLWRNTVWAFMLLFTEKETALITHTQIFT